MNNGYIKLVFFLLLNFFIIIPSIDHLKILLTSITAMSPLIIPLIDNSYFAPARKYRADKNLFLSYLSIFDSERDCPLKGFDLLNGYEAENKKIDLLLKDFLSNEYDSISRAVLFYGPPGTGKTKSLFRALFNNGIGVVMVKPKDLYNHFFVPNENLAFILEKVNQLVQKKPYCLVFDECEDVLVESSVKQAILTMLDGDGSLQRNVFTAFITNYSEKLPLSLLRPGRITEKIHFGLPDEESRKKIVLFYLKNKKLECDEKHFELLQDKLQGKSGADIHYVIYDIERKKRLLQLPYVVNSEDIKAIQTS